MGETVSHYWCELHNEHYVHVRSESTGWKSQFHKISKEDFDRLDKLWDKQHEEEETLLKSFIKGG